MANAIDELRSLKDMSEATHRYFLNLQKKMLEAYADDVYATARYRCKQIEIELNRGKKFIYKRRRYQTIMLTRIIEAVKPEIPTSRSQCLEPKVKAEVTNMETGKVSEWTTNISNFIEYVDLSNVDNIEYKF